MTYLPHAPDLATAGDIDRIASRIDRLEARMDRLEARIDRLQQTMLGGFIAIVAAILASGLLS